MAQPVSWQNWAQCESASPQRVVTPGNADEVAAIVRQARETGMRVKAVGAGHSFTGIAVADGIQLNMSALSGLRSVADNLVTLGAGTHLHQLPALLEPYALAMENLGDIDAQTIAGATSTGTHGTGAAFGGLATQIAGLTLVTAAGETLQVGPEHELFDVARVGLGALGIITEVTLQCVPAFKLEAVEQPEAVGAVLDSFMDRATSVDHFEFYWFPHTTTALTKTNTRLPLSADSKPLGSFKHWVDDELMSNTVFKWVCELGRAAPRLIPGVNRLASRLTGDRTFIDVSTSVFTTVRRVRFREMEYALPAHTIPAVLREIEHLIAVKDWRISFPLEVRIAAPDDLWLSTAHKRQTGYIAVHRYVKEDHHEYFRAVEEIFRAYEGRPHWGKVHYQDASSLEQLYPRFADFRTVRDKLDPDRLFTNNYLDRVLG